LNKHLHIVTLDVPYPDDYGGAIEQWHKIKWLHRLGVRIHLHCFTNKRPQAPILKQYCEKVHYYPRKIGFKGFSFSLPYIVSSRQSDELLKNLLADDAPILFEGVHCTWPLRSGKLRERRVLVRLHNVEYRYYEQLFRLENEFFRKTYYWWEARQLRKYERWLATQATLLSMSQTDLDVYQQEFGAKDIRFLPAFVAWEKVSSEPGKGCYCLYHGNLSINENEEAAVWLLQHVFDKLPIPFVIAGRKPSERLKHLAHLHEHTCLVADPEERELQDMIGKAQINILPSFNKTGVKLKLLNALYCGRHCLVNEAGVQGTGLDTLCARAEDADHFRQQIARLYELPFTENSVHTRTSVLNEWNNNERNARKLVELIWPAGN